MRKLYILLLLTFGSLVAALAQPTISIGDGEGCTSELICLPVTTENFTNINSLRFTISHNPAVLSFASTQNYHPDMVAPFGNLGPAVFTETVAGQVSLDTWETGECESPLNIGVTIDDDEVLFEMCYTAIGNYGDQTEVLIGNTPTPIRVTRNATLCNNIGLITESGDVTLCVRELNITAADISGNEGDQVCVDFDVTGFDALSGVQFTVDYDCNFLEFVSLLPNSDLPNNTLGGTYGIPGEIDEECAITVAWNYFVPGQEQPSLPDGETMFTVCYNILGDCETSTQITFSDVPTQIEAFNQDPDNPSDVDAVPFAQNPGTVSVNDCNPTGLEIIIDCGAPVEINEEFCVSFSAGDNFDQVREMSYLMQWNADILEFVSANDPDNLFQLSYPGDFDTSNVGNGILGLDWEVVGPSQNLNNMEVIYNVCFRVIGLGGDSPIQIVPPGEATSNGSSTTINSTNCVVEVIQPESVGINLNDMEVPLGGSDCLPVTVSNFTDVTSMEFTLVWDDNIWSYLSAGSVNPLISGAVFTPIGAPASSLTFVWDDAAGVTLANDAVLFEICYETGPNASPGDCDELITGGFPIAERATTTTSNGEDVGLIVNTGNLCVLFPEGFGLTAESTTGGWKDTICMNFSVESFDNITVADFLIQFDPTVLEYIEANATGWTGLEFTTPSPAGTIPAHFDNTTPVVLADGEIAFEVCFALIGDPEQCYDVTIEDDPNEILLTTVGEGSIVITDGEICVEDQIVIQDIIITPVSCPGACDGTVTIVVCEWEDQGFIGTTWHTEPNPQFTPLFLDNVCEDTLIFTVFDNLSGVSLRDTIIIPVGGVVPTAIIEGDNPRNLACDPAQIIVCAENTGEDVRYLWHQNTILPTPIGDIDCFFAATPGNYILEVVNNISGCTATDTVTVLPAILPEVTIDDPLAGITCNDPCVTLNGTGTGENITFTWSAVGNTDPQNMASSTIETADLTVCGPGTYRLTVRDAVSGCENTADVTVADDRIYPNACLDPDTGGDQTVEVNCDGTPITFNGDACSFNNGLDLFYVWYGDETFGSIAGADIVSPEFSDVGTYPLVLTEVTTGCTDTVYAHIIENSNAPEVVIDPVGAIDCNTSSITLNATTTPSDPDPAFEILWTGPEFLIDGTEGGLTPTAITPGTYELLVTNTENSCTAAASVTIIDQTAAPIASISNDPADLVLSCNNMTLLLDGTASSQADTITYQWYLGGVAVTPMGNADTLMIATEGEYILEVTNTTTGCTAADTVTVTGQFETPQVILDTPTATIDCASSTLSVTATVNDADNFTFQGWVVSGGGNIVSATADSLTITVDAAGIYNISVTSDLSGCSAEADFVVTEDLTLPTANVTTDTLAITCLSDFVTLDGTGSSEGTNFVYTWMNTTGIIQPDMPNLIQTPVSEAGTYQLTVFNGDNSCSADTTIVVVTDTIAPIGMIADIADLTCENMNGEITVVVTEADEYTVTWTGGTTPEMGETVTVSDIGTYTATIVNTETGCIGTAEITVGGDLTPPTIGLAALPEFDCADLTVQIDASTSGAVEDFNIVWSGDGTITPTDALIVSVDNVGSYTLSLTSIANGCSTDSTFTIGTVDELNVPEVIIATPGDLPCNGNPVTLDASATGDAADFASIVWTDASDAVIGNGLMVDVTAVGVYTLTIITNTPAACENSAMVTVNPDENVPVIDLGVLPEFDCDDLSVAIDASGSGAESDFSAIVWTPVTGGTITPSSGSLNVEVDNIGDYTLSLTFAENGCSTELPFSIVTVANLTLPTVDIATPDFLGCDAAPVTLDGTGSGDATDFVSTVWTDASATVISNTLTAQTTLTGDYTLTVIGVGALACENSATVAVLDDPNTPTADAGMDIALECEGIDVTTLDGSNSLPLPSATVTYEWVTLPDSAPLSGDLAGSMPTLTGAGQYQLIVTNLDNGCANTSEVVTVTLVLPDAANAGEDIAACDDIADLNGNALAGTQGVWTTSGAGIIDMSTDPGTMVSGLITGQNVFVWTLSATNCPAYSTDSVIVIRATDITAINDLLEITGADREGTVNFIDNDQLGGNAEFEITVLTPPGFGTYDTTAFNMGVLDLSLGFSDFGETEMVYQICSTECPNLCDTATIMINVTVEEGDFFVPNGITPNDDGLNDELIFDVLLFTNPEDLPDNELIIFSRWGDIIYEAKPYNNDWSGLNKEGKPVPEGTYYYILRLNIGQGDILRGDVTVIR